MNEMINIIMNNNIYIGFTDGHDGEVWYLEERVGGEIGDAETELDDAGIEMVVGELGEVHAGHNLMGVFFVEFLHEQGSALGVLDDVALVVEVDVAAGLDGGGQREILVVFHRLHFQRSPLDFEVVHLLDRGLRVSLVLVADESVPFVLPVALLEQVYILYFSKRLEDLYLKLLI